ncbi:MAG: SocA family protein [Chlamydiae bacterium]|nr:SocA family protein [Chlamydiota bacterium]
MEPDIISPKDVADFLLFECRERGEVLTNLKLQKLLYYAQAWYLVLQNKPLFTEDFQAWVHGPALPSQYQRFKNLEWRPILEEVTMPKITNDIRSHLTEIVNVFGIETASALELMTHNEKPWLEARKGIAADQPSKEVISKESMRSFYKSMK